MISFLYKPVATTIDGVKYNNLFEVSPKFEAEFKEMAGYGVDDPRTGNLRLHPIAVEIFRMRGAAWSGRGLASIELPSALVEYVKIVAFKDGERLYYDYPKMVFDKVCSGVSPTVFLDELRSLMRLFPNTVQLENSLMRRVEIGDRFIADEYGVPDM